MTVGKEGTLKNVIEIGSFPVKTLEYALVNGFLSALSDVSRPKDDNGKAMDDSCWQAARDKRMVSWKQGDWAAKGGARGESAMTALKEQYIDERKAAIGATRKAVEDSIKATIKSVFGDKEPATFDNFLNAVAVLKHRASDGESGDVISIREAIETDLAARAEAAAAERAKIAKSIDVSALDLGF